MELLPEHVSDVFGAKLAQVLTAAAREIDLLGRSVVAQLCLLALLFVADAFGEGRGQFVQLGTAERDDFLVIEQVFDAFGQARPLGLGEGEGTEAQDEPLAGAVGSTHRLQEAVVGVGAAVAGELDLADEHVRRR